MPYDDMDESDEQLAEAPGLALNDGIRANTLAGLTESDRRSGASMSNATTAAILNALKTRADGNLSGRHALAGAPAGSVKDRITPLLNRAFAEAEDPASRFYDIGTAAAKAIATGGKSAVGETMDGMENRRLTRALALSSALGGAETRELANKRLEAADQRTDLNMQLRIGAQAQRVADLESRNGNRQAIHLRNVVNNATRNAEDPVRAQAIAWAALAQAGPAGPNWQTDSANVVATALQKGGVKSKPVGTEKERAIAGLPEDEAEHAVNVLLGLEPRASNRAGANGGFTVPQTRINNEIDEARRIVRSLGAEQMRSMTQKFTDPVRGIVNPNYKPEAANILRAAMKAKYGNDPDHRTFAGGAFGVVDDAQPDSELGLQGGFLGELPSYGQPGPLGLAPDVPPAPSALERTSPIAPTPQLLQQARRAPDGNMYIPDPNRPGKFLKVEQ